MAATTWEEIRQLASDFQRAQLTSTTLKLSERNCVEIVQKLNELKLIEILYTTNGKEYLTPVELGKEIEEEIQVRGGRVNLVDLQQALNVDLSHIEKKVNELVGANRHWNLVLGQIISEQYLDKLAEEINERLEDQGHLTISELITAYALPGDFLGEAVKRRLGGLIQGTRDEHDKNVFYTQSFVDREKARMRGTLTALTRPIPLTSLMQQFELKDRMFHTILNELMCSGRVAGSVSAGQFIPDIYTKAQNEWINNFYKQNGYLEYDAVERLGVQDARAFISKRLQGDRNLLMLRTCCVGASIQESVEAQLDEALATTGWCDIMPLLPSVMSEEDSSLLLQKLLAKRTNAHVYCSCIVATQAFVDQCRAPVVKLMPAKAEQDCKRNPALFSNKTSHQKHDEHGREDRKEQRRQKAAVGGKGGGGTQGRESKTKAIKKKGGRKGAQDDESDEENNLSSATAGKSSGEVEFMSAEEIKHKLTSLDALKDCEEDFIMEIANHLYRPLRREYQEIVRSVFLQTIGGATTSSRKKTHVELTEQINGLWINAKLFEKGLKLFPEETQVHLSKHLLKTVCTDITNLVFNSMAADHMILVSDDSQVTNEMRSKILAKIPEGNAKVVLNKLQTSLLGKSTDAFFEALDEACGPGLLEIMLKKSDKKKEKQAVFAHKMSLAEQIRDETDAAMVLHLAVTLLVTVHANSLVHAPGRQVPAMISLLSSHLPLDQHTVLVQCHDLVVKQVKLQTEGAEDEIKAANGALQEVVPKVKEIALIARKTTTSATAEND